MTAKPLFDAYRDYLSLRPEPKVREWVEAVDWNMSERDLSPVRFSAERHLDGILDHVGSAEKRLVQTFVDFAPNLQWLQSYTEEDFGSDMINNYAHVEIMGTRGHFANNEFAGGIVLFGPQLHYPSHWHVAEEIYFPLTGGALWGRDDGQMVERGSGELIFHESNTHHEMKVRDVPLLALWLWHGGDLAQKSDY